MAISMHLAAFHKIITPKFHYEAPISYVSCMFKALGPVRFSHIRVTLNRQDQISVFPIKVAAKCYRLVPPIQSGPRSLVV